MVFRMSPRLGGFLASCVFVAGASRLIFAVYQDHGFMARGVCVHWDWSFLLPYIIANAVIGTAYYAIPSLLGYYLKKQGAEDQPAWITICFIAFILLCGTGHWIEILNIYYPMYGPMLVIDSLTALFSIGTAIALPFGLAHLMATPSRKKLQNVIDELRGVKKDIVQVVEPQIKHPTQDPTNALNGVKDRLSRAIERVESLTYRTTGDA